MTESCRASLSVSRGIGGALLGAAVAVGMIAPLSFGFVPRDELVFPLVGCVAVCGCAGWAAFAPSVRGRFGWSLVIVVIGSLPVWCLARPLELTPTRYKGIEHPLIYASETAVLAGPAIVIATVLTLVRVRGAAMSVAVEQSEVQM